MLNKRIINTGGGAACTTDTTQILDAGTTQSLALYRFEDNANDTASSTGKFGKGAVFNASNSSIDFSPSSPPIFTNAGGTISFWIKPNTVSANQDIFVTSPNGGWTSPYGQIIRLGSNGKMQLYQYSTGGGNALTNNPLESTTLTANTWSHVVLTMQGNASGNNVKYYLNGSLSGSTTLSSAAPNANSNMQLRMGYRNDGGIQNPYNGVLDQVRIFNKELSSSEVTTLYNETSSTVDTLQILGDTSCIATYRFEGNAQDLSGNYYNGTASNIIYDYSGTASNITYATGKFGKAAVFNGSNSKINVSTTATTPFDPSSKNFSISLWVNFNSFSNDDALISKWGGSNTTKAFWLGLQGTGAANNKLVIYERDGGTNSNYLGTTALTASTWHHIVYVRNASQIFLYIDNTAQIFSATNGINSGSTQTITIGQQEGYGGTTVDGKIDQLRIFDKSLSSGEVNSLYNETATSAASAAIDNPSTVAYYKMADGTDETGSYNGTASNVDFNVQGKYGFAGKFNGSSSNIFNSDRTSTQTTTITLSAWVKTSDTSSSMQILQTESLWLRSDYILRHDNFNGTGAYRRYNYSQSSIATGDYVHVCVVRNDTSVTLYVNNSVVSFSSETTSSNSGVYDGISIGARNRSSDSNKASHFSGSIDQIRIFNKAISAAEVTTLYNEVQCANTIDTPESYFNTKLFTPTTSTSALPVTGVGFAPDLIWAKYRGTGTGYALQSHYWYDTVRGINSRIFSNTNAAESTTNYVQSFDTDGITYVNNLFNRTGANSVVGWFWKAASSNTTNNDGTISSTVRASQESGFSIVKYIGDGSSSKTVGHGLSSAPEIVIVKRLDSSADWYVWATPVMSITGSTSDYIVLNSSAAKVTAASVTNIWGGNVPSATTIGVGDSSVSNASGGEYISYCFHSVDGYQRIGSYTGNGSANGPFVYTGFEPAWLLLKSIDSSGTNWRIIDNKRDTTNPRANYINADSNGQEQTAYDQVNFLTNGFQPVTTDTSINKNNDTVLFWAIAANPDTTEPTKANSFKTKLYTGDGNSSKSITGVGFQPDWTWIKNRTSAGENHAAYDSVRGNGYTLYPNLSNSQNTGNLLTLNSDGFTLNTTNNNINTHNYVSWNWKALDHDRSLPSINNDGSISSIVSANPAAGFSIVKYRGNGTSGATVGTGLSSPAQLIITKGITTSYNWNVSSSLLPNGYLQLNTNHGLTSNASRYITAGATTNTLTNYVQFNDLNNEHISYCFYSVAGHSKIGTYTISSSSDRVITSLGFSPSWVMVKRTDSSGSWVITDTSRLITKEIYADLNNAENTDSNGVQSFDSDGFTVGTGSWLGASGGTYLYIAFK